MKSLFSVFHRVFNIRQTFRQLLFFNISIDKIVKSETFDLFYKSVYLCLVVVYGLDILVDLVERGNNSGIISAEDSAYLLKS